MKIPRRRFPAESPPPSSAVVMELGAPGPESPRSDSDSDSDSDSVSPRADVHISASAPECCPKRRPEPHEGSEKLHTFSGSHIPSTPQSALLTHKNADTRQAPACRMSTPSMPTMVTQAPAQPDRYHPISRTTLIVSHYPRRTTSIDAGGGLCERCSSPRRRRGGLDDAYNTACRLTRRPIAPRPSISRKAALPDVP